MHRFWLIAGALNMLLALVVGAATGHRLEGEFLPVVRSIYDTAREMHFVHALGLVAIGIVTDRFGRQRLFDVAGIAFFAGILCFCGGIYLGYGPTPSVRPIIPIGGVSFMVGWLLFAIGASSRHK